MEQTRIELLKKLTDARGISGHEDEVAAILRAELEGHVDRFERDPIKNLFALKGMDKPGAKIMLNAHMDEVGLYVTRITKEGYLPVSYTHLRAHETDSYLVCRLLLEKKK